MQPYGLQRNPGAVTIEDELERAIVKAGGISADNAVGRCTLTRSLTRIALACLTRVWLDPCSLTRVA